MCLILFAIGARPDYPLIVAANRDEAYARPAAPAAFWRDDPRICGGRDLEQGGTWLGITRGGRFAAVTNYRQRPRMSPLDRSRGELTRDFLSGSATAPAYLQEVEERAAAYRGFSLLVGDANELWFYSNRGSRPNRVPSGIHGLSNHLLDEPWPKVLRGTAELESLLRSTESQLVERLMRLLADRTPAPDHLLPSTGLDPERERAASASFIAAESYGTRASTVMLVGADRRVLFREHRFGPQGTPLGETELRFEVDLTTPVQAPV